MKKLTLYLPLAAGLLLAGCGGENGNQQVISKRYVHKYGYAVSQSEWDSNNYPGQVITNLRNGVTITATYENGLLHGPCTHTHPHSQTVQYYYLYNFGELKKEVVYDVLGMPIQEKVQLSPHRYCVTKWFGDGTPMSIEDYAGDELLDGQYFALNNDLESRVERGNGLRIRRDQHGVLLSKDNFDSGYLTLRESFYGNGNPESVTPYYFNRKHGERKVFTEKGEPLAIEEWVDDQQHGKATYYANGKKQVDVYFVNGARNGIETHYIDGEHVEQEIHWIYDKRHGPTKFYVGDNVAKTEWYYDGKLVSKRRFDELDQMDQMITHASGDFSEGATR
jgi:antitoxin component YwqK of YwqJK toxin-antitoxin module